MSPEGKTLGMDATMDALRDNRPLDEQLEFLLESDVGSRRRSSVGG